MLLVGDIQGPVSLENVAMGNISDVHMNLQRVFGPPHINLTRGRHSDSEIGAIVSCQTNQCFGFMNARFPQNIGKAGIACDHHCAFFTQRGQGCVCRILFNDDKKPLSPNKLLRQQ